ncbi:MAG: PHP domain-containing protein [Clostridiales bacterium]|jgi:predicted metal-dependent phosphoesterase TrpH|nr:PHP domain-containing protein [Clostridiales bacterium]
MKSKVNFHIHTTHSDGGKTPVEIAALLADAGVKYFAITDHDQVSGNTEAAEQAARHGLKHIDGIELSCCFADGEIGLDESWVVHILGLGVDIAKMQAELIRIEGEKDVRLRELFDLLAADGYKIESKRVTINGRITARKTIAKELINKGYAANGDECYEKILNAEKYRKYAKAKPSIREGIAIIHACGGLAVWAHPFGVTRGGKKEIREEQVIGLLSYMIAYKIDGIEAYYHKYSPERIRLLEGLADSNQLIKSIGTDFHCSPFDSDKHPEYVELQKKESIVFDADGISPDERIAEILVNRG